MSPQTASEYRGSASLGRVDLGWMSCVHHFCFGRYQHPDRLSWGRLRFVNHNRIAAGALSPFRPYHRLDMLLLVESGSLRLVRRNGRELRIGAGEFGFVSAGIGVELALGSHGGEEAVYTEVSLIPDEGETAPVMRKVKVGSAPGREVLASGQDSPVGAVRLGSRSVVERLRAPAHAPATHSLDAAGRCYLIAADGGSHAAGHRLDSTTRLRSTTPACCGWISIPALTRSSSAPMSLPQDPLVESLRAGPCAVGY